MWWLLCEFCDVCEFVVIDGVDLFEEVVFVDKFE